MSFVALAILLQAASPAGTRTMTLQEAIDTALRQQPQLAQARAQADALAQQPTARTNRLLTLLNVRTAYFQARSQKASIAVAGETLGNQERHLAQIQGFVDLGTRPQIDLAQARTDVANAKVQLI